MDILQMNLYAQIPFVIPSFAIKRSPCIQPILINIDNSSLTFTYFYQARAS